MQDETQRLTVIRDADVTIVELTDRKILDEINISQIGDQLGALVGGGTIAPQSEAGTDEDDYRVSQAPAKAGPLKLVLDFASVSHMSSSALGMLITLQKRIRESKGGLRLCNIQTAIYEVFVITRLNEIFEICQTRQEAVASLRGWKG